MRGVASLPRHINFQKHISVRRGSILKQIKKAWVLFPLLPNILQSNYKHSGSAYLLGSGRKVSTCRDIHVW